MKTISLLWVRYISASLFLALCLLIAGCEENNITDPGKNPDKDLSILETIKSNSSLNTLEELLIGTDLSTTLNANNTKTIFAPSDAAFNKLPDGYLDGLTDQQKLDLLKYHVYGSNYQVINEIKREAIISLQGDPLFVEIGQSFGDLVNNRAKFLETNIEAKNGFIHIVDEVLIPDQLGNLADNIHKRYEYRKFYERITSAGLEEYLQTPGTKTLLATSDAGLDWYEEGEGLMFSEEQWKEIMKYHIIDEDISVTGPGTKTALATLSGDSVYLTVHEPGKHNINGNGDPYLFVNATNGKIFLTPGIMLPDKYIGVLTIMDKRFYVQTARAAMAVAKMTGRLYNTDGNADEKFTIFIPGDEAEGINTLPDEETPLGNILKYHVLFEKITADQLQHNQTYTTWQGEQITITRNGDEITINGNSTVRLADLVGKNGVVHVIDRVLTPPG